METRWLAGKNGYEIPLISEIPDHPEGLIICGHGLFSTKRSDTIACMIQAFASRGIAAVAFDLPAHGESPVGGEAFTIENCLDDLSCVERHFADLTEGIPIGYFSSSFGAYLNLIYLATRAPRGHRSFLRCTAVCMAELMEADLSCAQRDELDTVGCIDFDTGFTAPVKLTKTLFDQLETYDPFECYVPGTADLFMAHGSADEEAPLEDARRFAEYAHARFLEVEGAGHRFEGKGQAARVEAAALRFLA